MIYQDKSWAPGSIYFVAPTGGGIIKIGFSTDIKLRFAGLLGGSPIPLELLACAPGCTVDEAAVQNRFIEHRSHFEWFHPHPDLLTLIEQIKRTGILPEYLRGTITTPILVRWLPEKLTDRVARAEALSSQKARWSPKRQAA